MLLKCFAQFWKTQQWPQDWKRSVFFPIPKKGNAKEWQCQRMFKLLHNCTYLTRSQSNAQNSPSQALAICELELPDVQAGFRKGRGTRDQLPTSAGSYKKQESSRKTSISALLAMPKPLTVWITINCGKF